MRTNEIATQARVHVNTVRLYEQWGYISPVPRLANGYREYSERHMQQMRIARLAFEHEFIQNNLRKKATAIVQLSGHEQFHEALVAAQQYDGFLQRELTYANEAVCVVTAILQRQAKSSTTYTHQQMAQKLDVTEEVLRNWERNGLYCVARNAQNRRLYTEADFEKLLVIRTLRSAHFSIASILTLFMQLTPTTSIDELLSKQPFTSEFYHVTDELIVNVKKARENVARIIDILLVILEADSAS